MIIARIQGGLGNQLFQYAAAKTLATRLNKPFKLETVTSTQQENRRDIALQEMQVDFQLASKDEVKDFLRFPTMYRHKPAFFAKLGKNIYREPGFPFDQNFFSQQDPVYLDGYWQSPRYFKEIEEDIRREYSVKPDLVKDVLDKGKEMENSDSVAVHIRRGDFLNMKGISYHGVMSALYYEKALGIFRERVPHAHKYFFSDDIEWVKQNLVFDKDTEFVSGTTKSAIEDFYLMSRCHHNIIANSSFSWWPAWLNTRPDKIVIAPKKWFVNASISTADLIPSEWIRI